MGTESSWSVEERFLLFLWTGHFKENLMWFSFLKTAAFCLLLACPSWAAGPVDRRWWKQDWAPRLRSIFRSRGRRFFYLKERMIMSSKALVLCRSWHLAGLGKRTSKGMQRKAKHWETECCGGDPVVLLACPKTLTADVWVDFLILCPFYKLSMNTGICSVLIAPWETEASCPVFFPIEQ